MISENPVIQTEAVFGDALCRLYPFMHGKSNAQVTAWHIPIFHDHSFFEIMLSGDRGYRIIFDGETVHLQPHRLYIIPAGVQHCAADTEGMENISVGFTLEPAKGGSLAVFKKLSSAWMLTLKTPMQVSEETERCFQAFYQCGSSSVEDVFQKKVLTYRLIYGILQDLQVLNQDPLISGSKHTNLSAAIETLMERRKYRLEEIADILGYTPKHMALLIKKQYGCDFRTLRRERILEAAKIYLLSSQGMSIGEIADVLGYKSESAFYAFFKQETGCTPSAYRRRKTQEMERPEEKRHESE